MKPPEIPPQEITFKYKKEVREYLKKNLDWAKIKKFRIEYALAFKKASRGFPLESTWVDKYYELHSHNRKLHWAPHIAKLDDDTYNRVCDTWDQIFYVLLKEIGWKDETVAKRS